MRSAISFYLNGALRTLQRVSPTQTLLRYLRDDEKLSGTKEGCAEGDCGACTVMVSRLDAEGNVKREAINACIRFMPSLDGAAITTVEALSDNAADPHPVQRSLIDNHGSQCGFCTPGFVMSLYTAYRNRMALPLSAGNDLLAGNLCRCTGYGPILKAAREIGNISAQADLSVDDRLEADQLRSITNDDPVKIEHEGVKAFSPVNSDQLASLYDAHPGATLVSGATDVGLWVTKQHRTLPVTIFLNRARDLSRIDVTPDEIIIGAGVTYSGAIDVLTAHYPDVGELVRRIGALQVRNAGTIGGNIANGSPIGDMPPALIALGARLELRKKDKTRTLPLEDFFLGYGKQDRAPGEFVSAVRIPISKQASNIRCYKISKRFDQDISALCGCFNIEVQNGKMQSARIAFGGLAEIPKRASAVEAALIGKAWARATVEAAMPAFATDFSPISDMRASAEYRMRVAQNLLLKFFIESEVSLNETRLVGQGSAFT